MVAKVQSSQRFVLLSLFNIWPQLDKRRPLLPKSGRCEQSKQSSVWSATAPFVLPFPRPLSRWRSRSPARRVNLSRLASVSGVRLEILAGIYALTSSCCPADGDLSVSGSFVFFFLPCLAYCLITNPFCWLCQTPNPTRPPPIPIGRDGKIKLALATLVCDDYCLRATDHHLGTCFCILHCYSVLALHWCSFIL